MRKTGRLYHFWLHFKHVLTAWNTTGEAIHSPYLFHLVRFVLRDENSFYAFAEIERAGTRAVDEGRTDKRTHDVSYRQFHDTASETAAGHPRSGREKRSNRILAAA